MKSIAIIVTDAAKKTTLTPQGIETLKQVATSFGFVAKIHLVTKHFTSKDDLKPFGKIASLISLSRQDNVNDYVVQILGTLSADKYMLVDSIYLNDNTAGVLQSMFDQSEAGSYEIVHACNKTASVRGQFWNIVQSIYQFFIKLFLGVTDEFYLPRFCLFNDSVKVLCAEFPSKALQFLETNYLTGVTTFSIITPKTQKSAPTKMSIPMFVTSLVLFAVTVGIFASLIFVKFSLNLVFWGIIALFIFAVADVFALCYNYLLNKTKIKRS